MSKQHEFQALDAIGARRQPRMTTMSEPSFGRYNVPLFQPSQSRAFWPEGGWATIQCALLGFIIVCEISVIAHQLARHL